jgi:glycerophosphoryl diester phosphodiesterase
VARRGAADRAPEHTLPAYEAALAAGADVLGLDVRSTADEQLVVIRDARLERTTDGRGEVRARTVRELKRLDAGRWFGRRFRGQQLQTLAEVLERFRGRARFAVHLREGSARAPGIEERLVGLLQVYDAVDAAWVASLDHHALAACRALDPDLRLLALTAGRPLDPARLAPPGLLAGLGLDARGAAPADATAGRGAGLAVWVGPLAEPDAAAPWLAAGASALVTDRPEALRAALEA